MVLNIVKLQKFKRGHKEGMSVINGMKWIGVVMFLVGVIIEGVYGIYPVFNPENTEAILLGIRIGIVMMAIGGVILITTLSFERYREWKKMKEEIGEEELRP